jgi:methionyl-tRNA formyltransferase
MRVLLLSPYPERLAPIICAQGDDVLTCDAAIDAAWCRERGVDWIVAYGYRHILPPPVVTHYRGRTANLHIAYLPWNRGAHPNLWSWIEDTPKGVTLHEIDAGIDTGAILDQVRVELGNAETLATTYARLQAAAEELFGRCWAAVRAGRLQGRPQPTGGSLHRKSEAEPIIAGLPNGWDTPVAEAARIGREYVRCAPPARGQTADS